MKRGHRVLVLRPGALGDLLLALPALRALRRERASLVVAGGGAYVPVLTLAPDVDGVEDLGSALFAGLYCEDEPPSPALERLAAGFETAVLLGSDPDGVIRRRLTQCGIARVVGVTLQPRPSGPEHMARKLAEQACLQTLEPELLRAALLEPGRLRPPTASIPKLAVLHPGSGNRQKVWPRDCFEVTGRALLAAGWSLRILTGPADGQTGGLLAVALGQAPEVTHAAPPHVLALARELAAARLHLGNDSGPSHLAGLLGIPTAVIFGPTAPAVWSPCGPRVCCIEPGHDSPWPHPDQVLAALAGLVSMR